MTTMAPEVTETPTPSPVTIAFVANEWRAVARFASADPTRPTLHGVLIEPDGTVIATSGHALLAIAGAATQSHPARPVFYASDILKIPAGAVVTMTKVGSLWHAEWRKFNKHGNAIQKAGVVVVQEMQHPNYPNWQCVKPQPDTARAVERIAVNPSLLALFEPVVELTDGAGVVLTFHGADRGIEVAVSNNARVYGLVMPLRLLDDAPKAKEGR